MKLRVDHVYKAAPVITQIINENRPLPQKANYRLARMFAKLKPEHELIEARRNAMIAAYDHKALVIKGKVVERTEENLQNPEASMQPAVPTDKMPEFNAAWAEVANEEIEVAVEPIPLDQLDNGGGIGVISAGELFILDDLVSAD